MSLVVGVDEVGRGPLAGPVVAAAVALPQPIAGLADSKTLPAKRREALAAIILVEARVGLGAASVKEIDRVNILEASFIAMRRALHRLGLEPGLVLVDGNRAPAWAWPTRCIVGGDGRVPEIGAASIVAKVARDRLMRRLGLRYPAYGWAANAGYGTAAHRRALRSCGATAHHRRSFAPVAAVLAASSA